ncbi:MAG: Aminodeoxyfutalosine synthase [Candidatus Methanoperedenaceae archaeon GB37]|nr:MAG: Aminodeoxyfutalosine synthase [Candidatus Methanoperedenaceae archaeon GB37]
MVKYWPKIAHRLGIPTNCTMLFGHIEAKRERLEHLIALREVQDKTGVLFVLFPFVSILKIQNFHIYLAQAV